MRSVRRSVRSAPGAARPARDLAVQLSLGRAIAGALVVAAPVQFVRALGADSATAARVTWLTRMMGVRDSAIGVGGLAAARTGSGVGAWLVVGAVSDAVDAAVVAGALKSGRVKGTGSTVLVPVAVGAAVAGLVTAARRR